MVLKAKIFGKDIGVLSERNGGYFFQYFDAFVGEGLEISPFYLPLGNRVYSGMEFMAFEYIPSVFHDSLPDSFGSSLMAAYFDMREGSFDAMKNPLRKLSYMGDHAVGAIEYEPVLLNSSEDKIPVQLRTYVEQTRKILSGETKEVIQNLTAHPSPGGARPKAFVNWNRVTDQIEIGVGKEGYEPWIVKFYEKDSRLKNLTKIEYIYFQLARDIGLEVPEFDVVTYEDEFHFAVKRFDRRGDEKLHLHTLSALINRRFDQRGLIRYEDLFKTTLAITHSIGDVKEAYKRMIFNMVGRNCDDHGKNFSFLMDRGGEWSLAPAYDLIYSFGESIYKEHFLSLNGKRSDFREKELLDIAIQNGISQQEARGIIQKTIEVFSDFSRYAREIGLGRSVTDEITQAVVKKF